MSSAVHDDNGSTRRTLRRFGPRPQRLALLLIALTMALFAISCAGQDALPTATAKSNSSDRNPTAAAAKPSSTPILGPGPIFTEKVNLDLIAPPGPGRDLVIMNCDYCHSWVCTVRGQRTLDHWVMVEDVHRFNDWVRLSEKDWNDLFSYLEKNFDDTKPEPNLPPAFALAGCTHSAFR